jgi:hypothetical protein
LPDAGYLMLLIQCLQAYEPTPFQGNKLPQSIMDKNISAVKQGVATLVVEIIFL